MAEKEGGGALKGLRQLTMDRGPQGYGFHMYTNKVLKGQYIKMVFAGGPADLAGMLAGDHVLAVDGDDVRDLSHMKVVEKIRSGSGPKKVLVIDTDTEREMAEKGEELNPDNAIVMIPRTSSLSDKNETPSGAASQGTEETDNPSHAAPLELDNMMKAIPVGGKKRQQVKARDWKSSVQVYNDL